MLSIDGFASLERCYSVALSAINEKMFQHFREIRAAWINEADETLAKSSEPDGEPKRDPSYYFNSEIGAQLLTFDAFRIQELKTKQSVKVLSRDGKLINLPLREITPEFRVKSINGEYTALRNWARQDPNTPIDRKELVFGVQTYNLDFWLKPFLFSQVFEAPPRVFTRTRRRPPFGVVDWNTGTIDLRPLREYQKAADLFKEGSNLLRVIGVEPPLSIERYNYAPEAFPRALEPFDGCSIVVPMEWLHALESLTAHQEEPGAYRTELKPRDALNHIIEAGEATIKSEIKNKLFELFPEMSHRKFEHHWSAVTENRPELRRPGPRSKRRIETEF